VNMWDPILSAAGTRPCSLGSKGVVVVVVEVAVGPVDRNHLRMRYSVCLETIVSQARVIIAC
jgi:hypothetical protein